MGAQGGLQGVGQEAQQARLADVLDEATFVEIDRFHHNIKYRRLPA
jgi:hypothetical protein